MPSDVETRAAVVYRLDNGGGLAPPAMADRAEHAPQEDGTGHEQI